MPQADTEDGGAGGLESLGQVSNGDLGHGWVSGTIGDEETIIVRISVEVVIPWYHLDLYAAGDKAADLVIFLKTSMRETQQDVSLAFFMFHCQICESCELLKRIGLYHPHIDGKDSQ